MASKRSVPTDLFWDETFSTLESETQAIFVGLMLNADDYGRGGAAPAVLARKLAKAPERIDAALQVLHASQFIQCYQVEGRRYYHICAWDEWETLSKPARSRYPAPPELDLLTIATFPEHSGNPPEIPGKSGAFVESPAIPGKILSEAEAEAEENRREAEGEGPRSSVPYPASTGGGMMQSEETTECGLSERKTSVWGHVPTRDDQARAVHLFGRAIAGQVNSMGDGALAASLVDPDQGLWNEPAPPDLWRIPLALQAGVPEINENGPVSKWLTDWLTPVSRRQNRLSGAVNGMSSPSVPFSLSLAPNSMSLAELSVQFSRAAFALSSYPQLKGECYGRE